MSKYLVTGGAGFIGSHIVERLVRDGHRAVVLDNLSTGHPENLAAVREQIEWREGDASCPEDVSRCLSSGDVDGVFHLAAIPSVPRSIHEPLANQRSGEVAVLAVLEAARHAGVRRVVFSSSSAVYGNADTPLNTEDQPLRPLTPYGLSKWAGEEYCRVYAALHPAPDAACLRYFNVFGPRQDPSSPYSGVISIFLKCVKTGTAPNIYGDGLQTRDFVEVSNVVEANMLAMNAPGRLDGAAFNVATGTPASVLEVWNRLCGIAGVSLPPVFLPERAGDIRHSRASIGKISAALGYAARVPLDEGLAKLFRA